MKRAIAIVAGVCLMSACNVNVDSEDKNERDSFMQKADTTLEQWGDSAKAKFKDAKEEVKEEWNERFGKDSSKKLK